MNLYGHHATEKTRAAVLKAFEEVKKYHPEVDQVFFGWDGRWQFCGEAFDCPIFHDNVDIGILEDASDAVADDCGFPAAFAYR